MLIFFNKCKFYSNNDNVFFNLLMKPLRWSDIVCEMIIELIVNVLLNGKLKKDFIKHEILNTKHMLYQRIISYLPINLLIKSIISNTSVL